MDEVDDEDKTSELTCKNCNGYVRCNGEIITILYIKFSHVDMGTIGLYLEEPDPETIFFQWPGRTKLHRIHKIVPK